MPNDPSPQAGEALKGLVKKGWFFEFVLSLYPFLGKVASKVARINPDLDSAIRLAGWYIHPLIYSVAVFLVFVVSLAASLAVFLVNRFYFPFVPSPYDLVILVTVPLSSLVLSAYAPNIAASSRNVYLITEIPFASVYLAVLSAGAVSPYTGIMRLRDSGLFPQLSKLAVLAEIYHKVSGYNPIAALEKAARYLPVKEFRNMISGYLTTINTGGDVAKYMLYQSDNLINFMLNRMKGLTNFLAFMMEAYLTISLVGFISIYVIFIASVAIPVAAGFISLELFFLLFYIVLPAISIAFIYFGDMFHPKYPVYPTVQYKSLYVTVPVAVALLLVHFRVLSIPGLDYVYMAFGYVASLYIGFFGIDPIFKDIIVVALIFLIVSIPVAVADIVVSRLNDSIIRGLLSFVSELVEARRTGLTPEKSIIVLASQGRYGAFTPLLRYVASLISWGTALKDIYSKIVRKTFNWQVLVSLYILLDSIVAGGGGVRAMEILSDYLYKVRNVFVELSSSLRPLVALPYIGSVIMLLTAISIFKFLSLQEETFGIDVPTANPVFVQIVTLPTLLTIFMLALTIGKMVEGRLSAGLKHGSFVIFELLVLLPLLDVLGSQLFQIYMPGG